MSHRIIPPRLHVILARESPTAVIIRRGPSRQVAVYGWNRLTDEVRLGEWLTARLYERRSDLSPDGRHLIYFAAGVRSDHREYGGWTALSRAPYLKAITLLDKGDSWHGGGLFTTNDSYWLNDGAGHMPEHEAPELTRDRTYRPHENHGGECPGVYYLRLQRDGWQRVGERTERDESAVTVFEKQLGAHLMLRKLAHAGCGHPPGRGVYYDTHELIRTDTGEIMSHPDWEWADRDGARLAWTCGGCLHTAPIHDTGVGESHLVCDFANTRFEHVEAPY